MRTSRRAELARLLEAAGAAERSGESLARELGVSRVAVAKHIAALRELGYRIQAAPRSGYRLLEAPDVCIPEEVAGRLTDPLWVACEGGLETASTNDDAKRLARSGAPEGTVVAASRQSAGRGRLGRGWTSPVGGAYVSAVLRPALPPAAIAPLGLVAGVGVARALGSLGCAAALKWPNDVLIGGRKVAGILLEMTAEADTVEWVVFGCGINVAGPGAEDSAWVREQAPDAGVAEVAARVLDGIAQAYRVFRETGFAPFVAEYRDLGALWGREVTVRDAVGAVLASGRAETIDATGALVVATAEGEVAVAAGDVTLRREGEPR